jgi:diadenosine tetraphosphate (Ap4A) HIT family hydrolase
VFCSIVAGTAPAERVYEDDVVLAIMGIAPAGPGHVLVIPRTHSQDLWHIQPTTPSAPWPRPCRWRT